MTPVHVRNEKALPLSTSAAAESTSAPSPAAGEVHVPFAGAPTAPLEALSVLPVDEPVLGEDLHLAAREAVEATLVQVSDEVAADFPGATVTMSPSDRQNLLMLALLEQDTSITLYFAAKAKSLAQVKSELRSEASDLRVRLTRLTEKEDSGDLPYTPKFKVDSETPETLETIDELKDYLSAVEGAIGAVSDTFDLAFWELKRALETNGGGDSPVSKVRHNSAMAVVRS
ncbi:MAG: hypothetical protein AAFU77_14075 [Myxococcota bacterium]